MDHIYRKWVLKFAKSLFLFLATSAAFSQNSMIGDGFGGRLWYRPTNYMAGSYTAFSLCYDNPCDSSSNQLFGWGYDGGGELGNGPGLVCSNTPVAVPNMNDVRYYSTGYWTGAIKNDGTGWVWQDPWFPFPTQVITDVKFVDAGALHVSFVKNDGTVWSLGYNLKGQFGDGSTADSFITPVQMIGVNNAVRVACGYYTTYVLLADGSALSVGDNLNGLLGNPALPDSFTTMPGVIPGLTELVDIKAHTNATAALDANGDVYSWGWGNFNGDGDALNDTLPELVAGLSDIVAISGCTDGFFFLALDANKNCYTYGGLNSYTLYPSSALVETDVIDIMAGELFSYLVRSDGTLWAAGTSNSGCSIWLNLTDSAHIDYTPLDPSAVSGCPVVGTAAVPSANCSSGTITVYHFGGQPPYQYDIGTGPQSSNVFTDVPLGNYTVTVTDASGCVITVPCTVTSNDVQLIALALAQDPVVVPGGSTMLFGSGGSSYAWSPSTTLSCSDCANPIATPTETTTYCLTVFDGLCSDTACVRIQVERAEPICTAANIFVPTAFSPNASGKNDQQCVFGTECIASMTFRIYDRWGNKVFESTDPKACWDGTYNGQALDPAVFVYHLSATLLNGETVERQGNITLVR